MFESHTPHSASTKRSPIVLIRTLAAIEFVVVALYLLGTTIDAYKYELYTLLPFSNTYTYQTLKLMLLPLGQLAITTFAFLGWYRESYTARPGGVAHSWGVLLKKEAEIAFDAKTTINISSGVLGKLLHYGSIYVKNADPGKTYILKDISRPQIFLEEIGVISRKLDPVALLGKEESERLEFKSSLRYDHRTGKANRDLEKSAMKTVAAFLNSKGGHLVIGVNDGKKPVGIAHDYPLLQKGNSDGFENHFTQVFNAMVGPEFRHLVNVSFHDLDGVNVCVVEALESPRPVYLKIDGSEHFYIRTGNTTTLLRLSEIEKYNRTRFARQI